MLFTIHTQLHGYDRVQAVHLRPPTEANLLLCHYSNTSNFLGRNLWGLFIEVLGPFTSTFCKHVGSNLASISEALVKTSILHIKNVC